MLVDPKTLPKHTLDEMVNVIAYELVWGSMDEDYALRTLDQLLAAGGQFTLDTRPKPTFERTADATMADVTATYKQRGQEYADSWAVENLVDTMTRSTLASFGVALTPEQIRLLQLAALIDVKDQRIGAGGPWKRDSIVDGIAYRASYAQLREEYEAQKHPPSLCSP